MTGVPGRGGGAPPRTVGVCLVGHSLGSANLGVRALTESNMAMLRAAAAEAGVGIRFTLLLPSDDDRSGALPADTTELVVRAKDLLVDVARPRRPVRDLLDASDLAVDIGAGDSYTDLYGNWRLAFLTGAKVLFRRHRRAVVMAPQTIGPFRAAPARWAGALGLRSCRAVFGRDDPSCTLARTLAPRVPTTLAADVAFDLPFRREAPPRGGATRVGLTVSSLLAAPGARARFGLAMDVGAFVEGVARALRGLGAQVVLVPHVLPGNPVESGDLTSLAGCDDVEVARPFTDASDAKSFISGLDALVSARMHATIAAVSSGVPAIPIAYSKKVPDLYGALGYPYWIDARTAPAADAVEQVTAWLSDLSQLRAAACRAAGEASARLGRYRAHLVDVLGSVAA